MTDKFLRELKPEPANDELNYEYVRGDKSAGVDVGSQVDPDDLLYISVRVNMGLTDGLVIKNAHEPKLSLSEAFQAARLCNDECQPNMHLVNWDTAWRTENIRNGPTMRKRVVYTNEDWSPVTVSPHEENPPVAPESSGKSDKEKTD